LIKRETNNLPFLSYNHIGTYAQLHTLKWIKGNDHLTILEEVDFLTAVAIPSNNVRVISFEDMTNMTNVSFQTTRSDYVFFRSFSTINIFL
jgi:hypothetical protein